MSRFVTVYTPNYAIVRYKIVFDSRRKAKRDKKFKDAMVAADHYEELPAEDSSTKVFYVADSLSNSELLKVLNRTMEIATNKHVENMDKMIRAVREQEKSGI